MEMKLLQPDGRLIDFWSCWTFCQLKDQLCGSWWWEGANRGRGGMAERGGLLLKCQRSDQFPPGAAPPVSVQGNSASAAAACSPVLLHGSCLL